MNYMCHSLLYFYTKYKRSFGDYLFQVPTFTDGETEVHSGKRDSWLRHPFPSSLAGVTSDSETGHNSSQNRITAGRKGANVTN